VVGLLTYLSVIVNGYFVAMAKNGIQSSLPNRGLIIKRRDFNILKIIALAENYD
jgi:hypothetical protein